ncbi:MAG: protein kinase [Coriobacteriia bacterium]|nr:protein kinase [Coriobacteriia bacterium]
MFVRRPSGTRTPLPGTLAIGELGRGAMAVVWRAYDPALDREVAIKEPVMPHGASERVVSEYQERFVREAKAVARLKHSGIVTVHAAGVFDGRPGMVMELVEGEVLTDLIRRTRVSPDLGVRIIDELLDAVGYAHSRGVIHRDLKPDNIFVTPENHIKLADFGVAHLTSNETLTTVGTVLGTPAYMSPEQVRGAAIDARTDLFSIGVLAYVLLTGVSPFSGSGDTSVATILYRVAHEQPVAPDDVNPQLMPEVSAVIMRALEKDPDARYSSASEMRAAWNAVPAVLRSADSVDFVDATIVDLAEATVFDVPDSDTADSAGVAGPLAAIGPSVSPIKEAARPPKDSAPSAESTALIPGLEARSQKTPTSEATPAAPPSPASALRAPVRKSTTTHVMPVPEQKVARDNVPAPSRTRRTIAVVVAIATLGLIAVGVFAMGSRSSDAQSAPTTQAESPNEIEVPELTGKTWASASEIAEYAKFELTPVDTSGAPLEPATGYKVLEQDPAAGSRAATGTRIAVTLTGPQPTSVALDIDDQKLTAGQSAMLIAVLRNAETTDRVGKAKITFQWSKDKETWKDIKTGATDENGSVTVPWKPSSTGSYYVRALFAATPYFTKSFSAPKTVAVKAAPKPRASAPRTSTGSSGGGSTDGTRFW